VTTSRCGVSLGAIAGVLLAALPAAAVTEPFPDNTTVPQPSSAAEVSLTVSRGFPSDAVTLGGLFKYFAGGADAQIDPVKDASTTPGSFPARCGFKTQIVLKGGACKNAFGWYNATEPASKPPAIYPLVPANLMAAPPNGISCDSNDFCPLATRTTSEAPLNGWADPLPEFDVDIQSDPNWTGGLVGFALIGTPGSQCPQTKYSQADLNDKSPSGAPWITALIYHSLATTGAYYLAFEDFPTCMASWRGCVPGGTTANPAGMGNDGDFNDDVFYLRGLNCSLAGTPDGGTRDGGGDAGRAATGGASGAGGTAGAIGTGGTAGAAGTSSGSPVGGTRGTAGTTGVPGTTGSGGAAGATGASGASGASGTSGTGGMLGAGGATGTGGDMGRAGGAGGTNPGASSGCGCTLGQRPSPNLLWTGVVCGLLLARRRRTRRAKDQ
jgi:hypothetical protein